MAAIITSRPNVPEEVIIGTQIWMKRNYDFGGTHPDNVYDNINDYGKLYTWDEAMAINLSGWHLPTNTEINILRSYVGTNATAGGYLKEIGTDHWLTPNTDATDTVGFNARGAGNNEINFKSSTFFWSSTEFDADEAWCLRLDYNNAAAVEGVALKIFRFSVRLIKD